MGVLYNINIKTQTKWPGHKENKYRWRKPEEKGIML